MSLPVICGAAVVDLSHTAPEFEYDDETGEIRLCRCHVCVGDVAGSGGRVAGRDVAGSSGRVRWQGRDVAGSGGRGRRGRDRSRSSRRRRVSTDFLPLDEWLEHHPVQPPSASVRVNTTVVVSMPEDTTLAQMRVNMTVLDDISTRLDRLFRDVRDVAAALNIRLTWGSI